MYPTIQLVAGKEPTVTFGHPWIFSGALREIPSGVAHGDLVYVADRAGRVIATGTYSNKGSIAVRVFELGRVVVDSKWFQTRIGEANERRILAGYGPGTVTTGYRAVFSEADGIPGLIVDRYGDVIVFQISTAGLDRLRDEIITAIENVFAPNAIVERSDVASRAEEALEEVVCVRFGDGLDQVMFLENGLSMFVDPLVGQKTGFYLDQKDLRKWIINHECVFHDHSVLNLFSYTGATGIAAMKAGAKSVLNVDSSEPALLGCKKHAKMNGVVQKKFQTQKDDAFAFVGRHESNSFDIVILDPPALIKSRKDTEEGKKAYHFLNRAAMRLLKDGGVFITSSCSHFLSEEDFAFLLRRSSIQNGLKLDMIGSIYQASDHPRSIYFPEAGYLKTFCFVVNH